MAGSTNSGGEVYASWTQFGEGWGIALFVGVAVLGGVLAGVAAFFLGVTSFPVVIVTVPIAWAICTTVLIRKRRGTSRW